ncbi:MAG: rhodanese-like domain-containing protein [Marinobacterium sp.]|nr:rhodanese-like domain-containing protein [Marinobacterium sp.]
MTLPLVIEPAQLAQMHNNSDLLILDLSSQENYLAGHIPGAIHMESARLLCGQPPIANRLPTTQQLNALFSELGLTDSRHVVVYDDQNGALAGRMIWTLHCCGYQRCSFLNGLLLAWIQDGWPLETTINTPQPAEVVVQLNPELLADIPWLLSQLDNDDCCIWDARSKQEYDGDKVINAQKGGHIPGACWFEWTDSLRGNGDLRLKPREQLRQELAARGITGDKEVITHCQTHRRSGLTYLVARYLGFERVRCYDSSWFEWGNHPDTPVER